MKGALLLVMAVGGIVSVGCGDDRLRTLSQSDVVGIPAGDATGTPRLWTTPGAHPWAISPYIPQTC